MPQTNVAASGMRAVADSGASTQRDLRIVLLASFGVFGNYAPLLSVVPMWASIGGAGLAGAGTVTGMTMATTVAAQFGMGPLLKAWGLRRVFVTGALLMGLPTFGYVISTDLAWILPLSAVRGAGFGMVAVAGSALAAELAPKSKRGAALGIYGVAVNLPQVALLPAGVWMAEQVGFWAVFSIAGALALFAVPLLLSLAHVNAKCPGAVQASGGMRRLRRVFTGPVLIMVVTSCALGGLTTFLPFAATLPWPCSCFRPPGWRGAGWAAGGVTAVA